MKVFHYSHGFANSGVHFPLCGLPAEGKPTDMDRTGWAFKSTPNGHHSVVTCKRCLARLKTREKGPYGFGGHLRYADAKGVIRYAINGKRAP